MNVTPVQNNNNQHFGMALKLDANGARKIAQYLDEVNTTSANRMKTLMKGLHSCKVDASYDGEKLLLRDADGVFYDIQSDMPKIVAGPDSRLVDYKVCDSTFRVAYKQPQNVQEGHHLPQLFFNAREVAKGVDEMAAKAAARAAEEAAKNTRIEKTTGELLDLYGA